MGALPDATAGGAPASHWTNGRLVAFDIETTGVDVEEARIVTACVALVGGGQGTVVSNWLVDPGVHIPEEAAEIHGVTTERARAEGVDAPTAIAEITGVLAAVAAGSPLVAFNARFDLTILDREARRHGLDPLDVDALRVVDPFVLDKHIDRFRRGKRTLEVVCGVYDATLEEAHAADADAVAAARLAWRMGRLPVLRGLSLDHLHAAQVTWAATQAASLQEYFDRQGKDEHVEPAWPVVPVDVPEPAEAPAASGAGGGTAAFS